jgi:uncharacterized membrane protein YuzA (DUF378 family)
MTCNCKSGCICSEIAWVLVIIGGLNWGLVGLGMLIGGTNLNVVNLLLGSWPIAEGIVYLIVGIATVVKIFGCPCKRCKEGCKDCHAPMTPMEKTGPMDKTM